LTTGKQAEVYANDYIALHLAETNNAKTYAQTSNDARALRAQATAAQKNNTPDAAALNDQATALEAKVQTLFRGETLRGLLLTSYGFSIFGDRAQTAAYVCYLLAFVLFLAAIAGFIHAATKSAEHQVLVAAAENGHDAAPAPAQLAEQPS